NREKPEYVFLAAATVGGIHANNTYPGDFIFSNLCIQNNVIHAAYLNNVTKLLFLGSSCIYPNDCPQPMKEEHLLSGYLEPTNEPYAVAKIAGIKMCESYNRQYGTNYISVMPTNLYGPGDNFDLMNSHVLPAMIRKFHLAKLALQGDMEGIQKDEQRFGTIPDDIKASLGLTRNYQPSAFNLQPLSVSLWGTGTPRREFLHVDDLADACVFLMNNYDDSEIVNIGTGEDSTIKELAELVKDVVGADIKISWDAAKPDGTMLKRLDVTRLNNLGWKASIALSDGIKSAYGWYRDQMS
ncbi:MAG: GDP-L-fucose synthase, partial [Desulfobacteraceae bacterium]